MPVITNIAGTCQHYRIPYPMTRHTLSRLFTAVIHAHPEVREVCLLQTATCSSCTNFVDGHCRYCTGRHNWKPPVPPTENAMCKNCTHWQTDETVYLLDVTNEDVNFDIEASYDSNRDRPADTTTQHPRPEA